MVRKNTLNLQMKIEQVTVVKPFAKPYPWSNPLIVFANEKYLIINGLARISFAASFADIQTSRPTENAQTDNLDRNLDCRFTTPANAFAKNIALNISNISFKQFANPFAGLKASIQPCKRKNL
jgi:hypothetical protein